MLQSDHWLCLTGILMCGIMSAVAGPAIARFAEDWKQTSDARMSRRYRGDPRSNAMVRSIHVIVNYSKNDFLIDGSSR